MYNVYQSGPSEVAGYQWIQGTWIEGAVNDNVDREPPIVSHIDITHVSKKRWVFEQGRWVTYELGIAEQLSVRNAVVQKLHDHLKTEPEQ
jgi:hypothetical protein